MRLLALAIIGIALAACSGSVATGGAPASLPSAPSAAAAIDPGPLTDPDALVAAAADNDGQVVRVKGFLLGSDGVTRLCSVVLESYPPQCGGGTLTLLGEVPADVVAGLDRTTEPNLHQANWGWVEVTGTFQASGPDGAPTIAISEIRLAAP
jgi:hypothetical protein